MVIIYFSVESLLNLELRILPVKISCISLIKNLLYYIRNLRYLEIDSSISIGMATKRLRISNTKENSKFLFEKKKNLPRSND